MPNRPFLSGEVWAQKSSVWDGLDSSTFGIGPQPGSTFFFICGYITLHRYTQFVTGKYARTVHLLFVFRMLMNLLISILGKFEQLNQNMLNQINTSVLIVGLYQNSGSESAALA